ncbi:hypothetical protein D9M71_340700 [compost metagenome]
MFDDDLVEAYFKLFGNQCRHRRVGPLPHLHRLDGQEYPPLTVNPNIGIGREGNIPGLGAFHQSRQAEANHQAPAKRSAGFEKASAADTTRRCHRIRHWQGFHAQASALVMGDCPAAILIASRMRT